MVSLTVNRTQITFKTSQQLERWQNAPTIVAGIATIMYDALITTRNTLPSFRLSPPMMQEVARNFLSQYSDANRLAIWRQDLFGTTADKPLQAPESTLHILPNNLIVSAWESIFQGILTGALNRVRVPARLEAELQWMAEIIDSLPLDHQPKIQWLQWLSNDSTRTCAEIEAVDCVTVFGGEDTIEAVRALTPKDAIFVAHGYRFGIAVVDEADTWNDRYLDALAYDFVVYDQSGCLSPRAIFLLGFTPTQAKQFTTNLCTRIRVLQRDLIPADLSLTDASALRATYDHFYWSSTGNDIITSEPGDPFLLTLTLNADSFSPGQTQRHLQLIAVTTPNLFETLLYPWREYLSTVGCSEAHISQQIHALSPNLRICAPGYMQKPELGWLHDGRPPLLPYFRGFTG